MNCIICEKEHLGAGITCSVECGMSFRYLKKFNLSSFEIKEIISVKTNHPIKYKHAIWKKGFSEEPTCSVCSSGLTAKKLLSFAPSACVCSKECYKILKQKNCEICSKKDCKSQKCISAKRELKKYTDDLKQYIETLNKKYVFDENILFKNKLFVHGLSGYPECLFCGKEHKNITPIAVKDYCSSKCSNSSKNHKKSFQYIFDHYVNKGIPVSFLEKIDKHELSKIYSNKDRNIFKCECGSYVIDRCEKKCANRKNFNNLKDFNEEGLRKFVIDGLFDIKLACDFYNCSVTTIRRAKEKFGIQERCRNTIEDEIFDFLNVYVETKRNDRQLIKPKELDILCETFAVEYDGLLWHSEGNSVHSQFNRKGMKNIHLEKTELCEEKDIQLFHIFSNEWHNKQDIWKSMLLNKIGKNEKIFARKCLVKEVDSKTCNTFLEKNHMQGKATQSVRLGLFYNDELVSLMTFGKSRYNKDIEWELIRFCTKLNTQVIGGASKLLKHFERNYNPKSIISYANRRWSQGDLYEKLKFEFTHRTTPNYFYFHGKDGDSATLESREKYQKHKLKNILKTFDPNLTETENMYNNGYRKIFDCGNKVYVKHY